MSRHKMVYLAQPKPIMKDPTQNENIAWQHNEDPKSKHLIIEKTSQPKDFTIWKSNKITHKTGFIISINKFKEDIKSSIQKPVNGYFLRLESEALLKNNFKTAINQIFDPQIID
jgi:hypothetical protein